MVKKNDIINLPRSQDLNVQQIYLNFALCISSTFFQITTPKLMLQVSSGLLCCTCPISWCTSHFLHSTNLVVSWLLGSFQASTAQHLLFQTLRIVCFLWVKGLDPVLCRDLILLITPSSVFPLFSFRGLGFRVLFQGCENHLSCNKFQGIDNTPNMNPNCKHCSYPHY